MVINDVPVATEIKDEEKFTAISNMSLITSLRTGKVNNWEKKKAEEGYQGISLTDIYTTYLDYEGFEEGNFDYKKELCKKKDIPDGEEYYHLIHQKDVWVSQRLWAEFQALLTEIALVNPELIIVTGKWGLFFLTGCTSLVTNQGDYKDRKPLGGLNKFRSSIMQIHDCWETGTKAILVPIFHTIHAMSMPDKLRTIELDIEKLGWIYYKIKNEGVDYYLDTSVRNYIIGTDKEAILLYLDILYGLLEIQEVKVSCDIETKFKSIIDCIGLSYEVYEAICIPLASKKNPTLWSLEDEIDISIALGKVLNHKNCKIVGQNFSYDSQYFYKLYGWDLKVSEDTMIMHHTMFNYLPKSLDFLASLYCERYSYWKNMQEH